MRAKMYTTWMVSICLVAVLIHSKGVDACTCIREFSTVEEMEYLLNSVGISSFHVVNTDKILVEPGDRPGSAATQNKRDHDPKRESGGDPGSVKFSADGNRKNVRPELNTVDRMDIHFGFSSVLIYPQLDEFATNLIESSASHPKRNPGSRFSSNNYIKFVPQTTCGVACQQTSSVTERWLVKDNKIVNRAIVDKETVGKGGIKSPKDQNPWDLLIAHMALENAEKRRGPTGDASPLPFGKNETISASSEDGNASDTRHPHRLHGSLSTGPVDMIDRGICCRDCCDEFMKDMRNRLENKG